MSRRRPDGSPYPLYDPYSSKYPDRSFVGGVWRTKEQLEASYAYTRGWRNANREHLQTYAKERYEQNAEAQRAYSRRYHAEHREILCEQMRVRARHRYATDPMYRLKTKQDSRRRDARLRKEIRLAEDQAA